MGGERMWEGRRCRQREKSGEGKTVRDFVRMLVVVSSRSKGGLNWYLCGPKGTGRERWLASRFSFLGGVGRSGGEMREEEGGGKGFR